MRQNPQSIQSQIEEAIFNYTIGENSQAKESLQELLKSHPNETEAWHALSEILWSEKDYTAALKAAEEALKLKPDDLHINTTLSRIWVQIGDQKQAEHYNAQARMLGWKETLKKPAEEEDSSLN
jgi:predicted Zn-dependent protease